MDDESREQIITSIIEKSNDDCVQYTREFVSFVLSLMKLYPIYRLQDEEEVVNVVSDKLLDKNSPSLGTLQLQYSHVENYPSRDEVVKRHRRYVHQKVSPLIQEICETCRVSKDSEFRALYHKILVVISLLSGLGSPSDPDVLRETTAALQSVYKATELPKFVGLTKREKEETLIELMCLVAGIRIFNNDCEKSDVGIDDLPCILCEASSTIESNVLRILEDLMIRIYRFETAVENGTSYDEFTEEDVTWAIETLTKLRQQEIYVRQLLSDIKNCRCDIDKLVKQLEKRLITLHNTVRFRTAVPASHVYPQFIDLADIWMGLQDQVILLYNCNSFVREMQAAADADQLAADCIVLQEMIKRCKVLTDAQRLEKSMGQLICCENCKVIFPNETKGFDGIELQFLGFCAWSFVKDRGALILANPNNGIAQWRDKYFAFSSIEAAENFGMEPHRFYSEAIDFIREHLEYVHLFNIEEELESIIVNEGKLSTDEGFAMKTHRNFEIQTEVHPIPRNIVKDYTSSVWEYRRRALQLANICRSATKSTQTYKSHFRGENKIQVAPPKHKEVQTRKDVAVNSRSSKMYIYGLRGTKEMKQHVIYYE